MSEPEILYHGDRDRLALLRPRPAVGFGGAADCQTGVYAVAVREWAIPFAIAFAPTAPDAVFTVDTESNPPRIRLRNTEIRWNQKGYLYTLPAEGFEQIDERQWISHSPVKPLQVEEIDPRDFRGWMDFTGA